MDLMSWSGHFRCFPGQGDMPLLEFMEAVAAGGYQGELSLKIFNDQFRAGSPRSIAIDGQRSLIYLLDQLRQKNSAANFDIPAMPPRSKCLGVEFIEFAVDERTGNELGRFFSGIGFQYVGKHKSKAVARWSQGSINLVINQEKEGFAHSHYITHGPSVCAIGLKVQSAADTLSRAEELRDTPFRQKVGPRELEIPAVRGMGGSLLYFVDPKSKLANVWDIEFDPVKAKEQSAAVGLTVVDHISQSTHYEDMLSWLLFYTSLLEVRKTPQLDISDPGGIVRSQVVETADGTLRIALNASQSQRTQSSRFLNEYFGSGVQHVAFATDDIVATAKKLKANGVAILSIPEIYYDDLESRADLSAERLKVLKDNNVLYDKDADGEYLQIYTQSFKDLFFLEIVERRGYKGFGAINAPIRLSAQSRLAREHSDSGL
jgi:4-hydroxyphenylpyruvate dioxygenase